MAQCRFVNVCRAEEVAAGRVKQVFVGDEPIAICRVNDEFYAVSDICTHDRFYLSGGGGSLDGYEIECPRHATVFDIRTGEVEIPPADKPLPTYPCRVVDGEVQVGVPE